MASPPQLGVDATPTLFVSRNGGEPDRLDVRALEPEPFTDRLDPLVGRPAG